MNTVTTSPGMKLETEQTDHGDENYAILLLGVLGCLFCSKRLSYNFELSLPPPPPSPSRKQPLRRYIHAFIWKSSNVHQTDQSRFLDEMAFLICVFKMFTKQRATLMYITCIVCTCTCVSKHKTTIVYFRLFLNL